MKVQYQIMELDFQHLKKAEFNFSEKQDRVCFRPAQLNNLESNIQDSMEEALDVIETSGEKYKEYTVIPRIFMNDFED